MPRFGEYCPECDKNNIEVFVEVAKSFKDGDIVICKNNHKLKCYETDSQYIDVDFKYIK